MAPTCSGIKDDPAGSVDSKTEIVADGPEQLDLDSDRFDPSERVEDYLVDTATGKIVAMKASFLPRPLFALD